MEGQVTGSRSESEPPRAGAPASRIQSSFPELPTPPLSAPAHLGFQPPVRFPRPAGSGNLPVSR